MFQRKPGLLAPAVLVALLCGCGQTILNPDGAALDLGPGPGARPGPPQPGPAGPAGDPDGWGPPGRVSTVTSPEAGRRPISMAECICLALENGRTGEFYDRTDSDRRTSVTGLQQQGPAAAASDSVRVFAYDPAIAGTLVEQALSRFDVLWRTGIDATRSGMPSGFDAGSVPLVGFLNGEQATADFHSELLKPLPTGGVAGITFRTEYARDFLSPLSVIQNPAYLPGVELSFEQPLLQGGGVFINELREALPPSLLHPLPSGAVPPEGAGRPGILLSRIAHEQTRLDFERRVHQLLFVVEEAYWDLYCAYWDLYSRENGMRQAHVVWEVFKRRFDAGGIPVEDLAQIEEQYHFFRAQRLEALGRGSGGRPGVLEAERRLRYVVGLPPEDGTRLIPTDAPVQVPVEPSWEQAVEAARQRRPELLQIKQEIKAAILALARATDFLLPDLRFVSRYGVNGLGGTLGGGFRNLAEDPFGNWELGLQMQVPLGYRAGFAEVARAKLVLAQRFAFLRDEEVKAVLSLQRSYRDVVQFREEVGARRSQREAAALQVKARYEKFKNGEKNIDLLLRAQRGWADSLRDEQVAVCRYNVALADLERQKGTIMQYHNVALVEGPLPAGAAPHASERLRLHHADVLPAAPAASGPPPDAGEKLADLLRPQHLDIVGYVDPSRQPPPPVAD
jgi:outer membrane protein TolC